MFLFWKVRWFIPVFMLWEFYSNETARDSRLCEILRVIFSEGDSGGDCWRKKQKTGVIIATMRTVSVMMVLITTCHNFFWGLLEIAGGLSTTHVVCSHHFLSFWLPLHIPDARPPMRLYHSGWSVWHTYFFPILSSTVYNQRNNKTLWNSTATFSVSRSEEASTPGCQSSTRNLPHKHICTNVHTHTHIYTQQVHLPHPASVLH